MPRHVALTQWLDEVLERHTLDDANQRVARFFIAVLGVNRDALPREAEAALASAESFWAGRLPVRSLEHHRERLWATLRAGEAESDFSSPSARCVRALLCVVAAAPASVDELIERFEFFLSMVDPRQSHGEALLRLVDENMNVDG